MKFDEWGKDYPGILREVAKYLASAPYEFEKNEYKEFYRTVYSDKSLYPPIKQWLGFYRNQRALFPAMVWETLATHNAENPLKEEFIIRLKDYASKNEMSANEVFEMLEIDDPVSKALVQSQLHSDTIMPKGADRESHEPKISSPEALFLFKVYISCYLFYGDFPGFIYRKARGGDIDSICKLLRIDKRIIADHRIADAINFASLDAKSSEYKKICKAFGGALDFPSMSKMKTHMAAFIKRYFERFGINIKTPAIQSLFDAAYVYYHPDEMQDTEISDTPESFRKSIKRKADKLRTS